MTVSSELIDNDKLKQLEQDYNLVKLKLTPEQKEFITTKFSSKLWRIDNLYYIQNKDGKHTLLKLNYAQRAVLTKYKHTKKIILKSRQQGISTLFIAYYLDMCLTMPGFQAGIQSYGQDEANKLAYRARYMWDNLDKDIKEMLGLKVVMDNSNGLAFNNGSMLRIGNFRGDTLQGLHVSELGKIAKKYPEKARELQTGAFEAVGKNNRITVESTAEGKSGLFYDMWQTATSREKRGLQLGPFDFQPIFLSWVYDVDCNIDTPEPITKEIDAYFKRVEAQLGHPLLDTQKWWYQSKFNTLKEHMKREYPTFAEEAFEQSLEGTYYESEYKNLVIRPNLYDKNLKVHAAMDLGMNDTFSIGFFQVHSNGKLKIISEFHDSGKGLPYYADVFEALSKKFGWVHGQQYVPHDINVRDLGTGKTRWQTIRELGFNPVLVVKHKLIDGIEATRQFLADIEIDDSCEKIINAIQGYRKKYDDRFQVYLDSPVHDELSHTADMIRYMAMGARYKPLTDNYVRGVATRVQRSVGYDI